MGGVTSPLNKGNISCEEKEAGNRAFGEFKTTEGTRGMSGDGDNNIMDDYYEDGAQGRDYPEGTPRDYSRRDNS